MQTFFQVILLTDVVKSVKQDILNNRFICVIRVHSQNPKEHILSLHMRDQSFQILKALTCVEVRGTHRDTPP